MARTILPVGSFAGDPLAISDRCVNRVHRGAACTRCADVCPVDAVRRVGGVLAIDAAACARCGACVPVCPTEAIASRSPGRPLHFAVDDTPPRASVTLACPRGGEVASSRAVVRDRRCLAALGPAELLDLAGDPPRHLWLDDAPCSTCELGALHAVVESAAARANELREAFELEPIVHLTTAGSPTPTVDTSPRVVDAHDGAMSRRGIFRRLAGEIADRAEARTSDSLPPRRQRLLRRLRAWVPDAGVLTGSRAVAPGFGDVRVDADRCSACGLCAKFCPTDALVFTLGADSSSFTLSFQPARCVDCGICTVACPESAITVDGTVDPVAVVSAVSTAVADRPVAPCEACGVPTASVDGTRRCFSCRSGVVSPLHDEVGLMADLLRRLPECQP